MPSPDTQQGHVLPSPWSPHPSPTLIPHRLPLQTATVKTPFRRRPEATRNQDRLLEMGDTGSVPDADQTRSRGDLVSERISDLCSCKRQLPLVEFQKSFEIQENPLCRFWPQVPIKISQTVATKEQLQFSNRHKS